MRMIPILIAAALVLCSPFTAVGAGEKLRDDSFDKRTPARQVTIQAMLISASNEAGETDARLSDYESNLKRTLRFERFSFLGEGSTRINMPGDAEIDLPQNQSVRVEAAYYGEREVWLRVIWMDGGRQFMNVVYAKWRRGQPIVVGGASRGGQNLAIIVTPK